MKQTILSQVVLPAGLFVVMLGMGLSLVLADFARVLRHPRAAAVGICCQMLLLPLVGYLLVRAFGLESALGVGLIALALSPGGVTSNMYAYLARGDVALSISLTAVVSLVAPFTIPPLLNLAMKDLIGSGQVIALPLLKTILQLVVITLLPLAIGMTIRRFAPRIAVGADKPVKVLSIVVLLAIIGGIVKQNWAELPRFFAMAGLSALTLNVLTMCLGYGISTLLRLERRQRISIGIEVGIQNGTTALLVTGTLLNNPVMMIAPGIYSLIMFGTGALYGVVVNLKPFAPGDEQRPAAA